MQIRLHKQATTTPKVRAAIQASDEPAWVLAQRHGTTEQTVWKWRKRDSVEDCSHTPHRLQTTLTPALDPASPEIAFVDSHNPEEGSVSLAGPVDPLAQSSVDAVDGVAVKPGEFGRLQGGQISGKVSNNLPKLAF